MTMDCFIRKILYLFDERVLWKFYYETKYDTDDGIVYTTRTTSFFLGKPKYVANDFTSLINPTVFVFDINKKGELVIKFGKMYLRSGKTIKPIKKVIVTELPKTDEDSLIYFATVVLPRILFSNYLIDDNNNTTLLSVWLKVCHKLEERERQLTEKLARESAEKQLEELAKKAEEERIKKEKELAKLEKCEGEIIF